MILDFVGQTSWSGKMPNLQNPKLNMTINLEKRTQRARVEEAIFGPRSTIILATTTLGTVLASPFLGLGSIGIGVGGLALWGANFAYTYSNSYKKAVAYTVEQNFEDQETESGLDAQEIEGSLDGLLNSINKKVPADIFAKVESIRRTILEILPQVENISVGDQNIYNIRQVALTYLPETLANYRKLPAEVATKKPLKDGKTAHKLLLEQLDLLDGKLKEILEDFVHNDTDRLLVHGRFLEEKFAQSELLSR